jgi:hypothetical protein
MAKTSAQRKRRQRHGKSIASGERQQHRVIISGISGVAAAASLARWRQAAGAYRQRRRASVTASRQRGIIAWQRGGAIIVRQQRQMTRRKTSRS